MTERYRGLEHLERQVIELRDHCARELPRESPGPQWPTASTLTKLSAAVLLAAGLLGSSACTREVHASTVNAAAVGAAASSEDQLATNERTTPAAEIGELWVDDTISVDDRDRPVAYEAVLNTLLDASTSVGVRVWLVHAFGEEPWREAPFQRMQVPVWQRPACEAPSEASQIFKLQRANQQQQCDERIRAAERLHRQQVDHQLVAVRDA